MMSIETDVSVRKRMWLCYAASYAVFFAQYITSHS